MKYFLLSVLVLLASCESIKHVPALRVVSEEARPEEIMLLQRAISGLLEGVSVQLSEDAFISSPELLIERAGMTNGGQQQGLGRSYEMPEQFKLWKKGDSCFIERVSTNSIIHVANISCTDYLN